MDRGLPPPDYTGPVIYWTECDAVIASNLDFTHGAIIARGNDTSGVAVDAVAKKVYWTDEGTLTIERANLDGSARETLHTGHDPTKNLRSVAVDHAANRIYWTDGGTIRTAALDGSGPSDFNPAAFAISVAVDDASTVFFGDGPYVKKIPANGSVTEVYFNGAAGVSPSIAALGGMIVLGEPITTFDGQYHTEAGVWQMRTDGSGHTKLTDANVQVGALAIDPVGHRVYFTDVSDVSISSVGFDGTPAVVHYKPKSFSADLNGIAVFRP